MRGFLTIVFVVGCVVLLHVPVYAVVAAENKAAPAAKTAGDAGMPEVAGLQKELTLDLGGGVKLELVLIRPGAFMMGSEKGEADEKPAHKVTISKPFYIGKYLVTQEQWDAVLGTDPSYFEGARLPVEQVNWSDCRNFTAELNAKFPGKSFRLPTEAEWEYACRAGSVTEYCFGDNVADLAAYGWSADKARLRTHPVGKKKPNAWGLYDMHGNVWEWCQSLCKPYPYADDGREDPGVAGPRVLHGGAWCCAAANCRSACRWSNDPTDRSNNSFGCRVVLAVQDRPR